MGKTMNSTVNKTPRAKGRRSTLLELNKVLGKAGKKVFASVSYGSRGVSSYLNSPVARKRRSGNYMAELTEYREVREVMREGHRVNTSWGQAGRSVVLRTPNWKRRGGFKHCLGHVLARGKRFFVTPVKHKRRFFKGLTPDKLTGGWRGDLAELSRKWEVFVLDTCVLMHKLDVVEDILSCNGPMIYIATIVRTELDGLKKSPKPEEEQKARRASRWVQKALKEKKIATQTALEEEQAKSRWPQDISGPAYGDTTRGDTILLATYKWLVDVKGVQADKAVIVTDDRLHNVAALTEKILVCDSKYLKSKISTADDSAHASPNGDDWWQQY